MIFPILTGLKEKNDIVLTIEDDGIGIQAEQMDSILSEPQNNNKHGYGIRNINERIKLYYGAEYGLSYQSTPGQGTVVTVRIPAIKP